MSCRTRRGSSAAITIARMLSGLDDQQTISVFHRLTHSLNHNGDAPAPPEEVDGVINQLATQMSTITGLSDARGRSIANRLFEMRQESYSSGELQALRELVSQSREAHAQMARYIGLAAYRSGTSEEDVRAYVDERIRQVREAGRSVGPSRGERLSHNEGNIMPHDRGTTVAMNALRDADSSWRCPVCGQFRSPDATHVCPGPRGAQGPPAAGRTRRRRVSSRSATPRVSPALSPEVNAALSRSRRTAAQIYQDEQLQRQATWVATERSTWADDDGGMELFQAAYNAARQRKAAGEPAVPLDLDSPGIPGRKFGVEIEFNLPNHTAQTKNRIMSRLVEAGIFEPNATWERYHGPSRARRANGEAVFSIESDCTVDGELVTPPLDDTPENWQKIATICRILKEEGATAGSSRGNQPPGGHVHVSLGDFDHGVQSHDAILGTWGEHNDTLWRLSSHPDRAHRTATYCNPDVMHYGPHTDVATVRRTNAGHHTAINFESVVGSGGDHVEYRAWDETLDPGVIQAQVRLSLGITEAALRDPQAPRGPTERVGSHYTQYRGRRLSGEEWRDATRPVRSLVDHIFSSERHKEQVAALFATTRWQRR